MTASLSRLAVTAAVALLAGCGVAADDTVRDIDPGSVPGGLLDSAIPTSAPPTAGATGSSTVYFTDEAGLLVGVPRTLGELPPTRMLQALMAQLTAGPEAAERSQGMSTTLPPTMILTVVEVANRQATIDLTGEQLPSTDQTAAIAQIVLSATSLPATTSVVLTLDGEPLDAPLVDGAQTSRPLVADDYRALLAPG